MRAAADVGGGGFATGRVRCGSRGTPRASAGTPAHHARPGRMTAGRSALAELSLATNEYASLSSAKAEIILNKSPGTLDILNDFVMASGIPVPTKSTVREMYPDPSGDLLILKEIGYQIDPLKKPNISEYTLTAFGLPEPVGVSWAKSTPIYVWILVASPIFAMGALFFSMLSRRAGASQKFDLRG